MHTIIAKAASSSRARALNECDEAKRPAPPAEGRLPLFDSIVRTATHPLEDAEK
jgi:hypothetical protein